MRQLLIGALSMGFFVVGLFFMRFWRQTRDWLFFIFGIAFWIMAINRIISGLSPNAHETPMVIFWVRFLAFALILAAIVLKNLGNSKGRT